MNSIKKLNAMIRKGQRPGLEKMGEYSPAGQLRLIEAHLATKTRASVGTIRLVAVAGGVPQCCKIEAARAYYTTSTGRRVRYPNAYMRKALSARLSRVPAECNATYEVPPLLIAALAPPACAFVVVETVDLPLWRIGDIIRELAAKEGGAD
jgi:hypothetical protein